MTTGNDTGRGSNNDTVSNPKPESSADKSERRKDNFYKRRRRSKSAGKAVRDTDSVKISQEKKMTAPSAEVEEKKLGPGRKRRIFNRNKPKNHVESDSSNSKKEGDESDNAGRKRNQRGRRNNKRKESFQKNDAGAKNSNQRRSPKGDNQNSRRKNTRRSNQGNNRNDRKPANAAQGYAPAKDAPDGAFEADTFSGGYASDRPSFNNSKKGSGSRNRELDDEIVTGKVEWFSSVKGRDFTSMNEDDIEFLAPHKVNEEEFFSNMPVLDTAKSERGVLMDVVGVKTHRNGIVELYDCENDIFQIGEEIVVETARGMAIGEVKIATTRCYITEEKMPRVFRQASKNDMRQRERNNRNVADAFELCKYFIVKLNLRMKLVEVVYMHGGNKAVFYFMAEGRVDFRTLVKELARELHIRVEMRQIGVRDASKMIGGIGPCGQTLCCSRYIKDFGTVSIKMAKDQDLVLNPEKVSGQCGRLMCCLAYENDVYREKSKGLPKIGRTVLTPDGEGRVRDRDILRSLVRVQLASEPGLKTFEVKDISPVNRSVNQNDNQLKKQPE